jgi:dipeptidyl aminopeptidase/acylaminoacyl peptidase
MRGSALPALLFLLCLAGRAEAQMPSVEAYGRLPAIADVSISPNGQRVALALSDAQGQGSVAIVNLDRPSEVRSFRVAEGEQLRGVNWADDERVSYSISRTFRPGQILPPGVMFRGNPRRVDYWRTGLIDVQSGRVEIVTTNEDFPWADAGSSLIAPIEDDPGYGRLIGSDRGEPRIWRINLSNARVSAATPRGTNENTVGFQIDERGNAYARFDSDEETNRWRMFIYDGNQPRLLIEDESEFGEPITIVGLMPDNRIIAHDRGDGDFYNLYIVDRVTGERTLFRSRDNTDMLGTADDPWTRRAVGVIWSADRDNVEYMESDLQAVSDRIDEILNGSFVDIITWSRDRQRFIVYAERGLDGGGYYVYERNADRIRLLGLRYPELQSAAGGERQSITYRARDGARIPAYLTFPAGAERRNLPLVLLVHGGPHARDSFTFDWWASFLASRGYLVLQPNFRGSTGFGKAWEEAGRRQWGGLMQTDVEDGVAALIRSGVVDPARVCIVGASYGGYAALAGATLTPDRYSCAVAVAPVSDLEMFLRESQRQTGGEDSMTSDWWRASIGDREEDRARIRAVSPANLADRVQAPVLLVHGTDDIVVPIAHSRLMRDRLERAGRTVRYVELSGDDHWLSDAPTRIQMLRELDSFLGQHLRRASVDVDPQNEIPTAN